MRLYGSDSYVVILIPATVKPWMLSPRHRGLLPLRLPEEKELVVLRTWPTQARLPTNVLSTLVDSIPLHSIQSVGCPGGFCAYSLLKDVGQVCRAVLMLYVYVRVLVYIDVWHICMHMRALQCIV